MARFLHHDFSFTRSKSSMRFLASFWIAGLLSGIWVFAAADVSLFSLMRSSVHRSVSIVSLLLLAGLPFLFSAFAVFISCPGLIFPVVFCKGICFSFVSMGILHIFPDAGWLMWFLICFSDVIALPLLYWFWRFCFHTNDSLFPYRCMVTASILLLTGSLEHSLIQPFLADLLIL